MILFLNIMPLPLFVFIYYHCGTKVSRAPASQQSRPHYDYYGLPPRSRDTVPAYCLLVEERNPVWRNLGHRLVLKFEGPLTSLILLGLI
jgi:hypothetical protein